MAFLLLFMAMMATAASGVAKDSEVAPVSSDGSCGPDNFPGFKIINGKEALPCQFPWQAYVVLKWSVMSMKCGGSIINDQWILTAAHCLVSAKRHTRPPPQSVVVYTGMLDKRNQTNRHIVSEVVVDPRYHFRYRYYDAALLKLAEPIKWDRCHAPVCLNSNKTVDPNLGWCVVSGWGVKANRPHWTKTNKLLFAKDKLIPQEKCKEIYQGHASENTICGISGNQTSGRAVCFGDSGGPLVCKSKGDDRYYQHGIVSRYLASNPCAMEALYTNVGEIYNWITRTIRTY